MLADCDRTEDLAKIKVPTLVIAARYDIMDPKWMEMKDHRFARGDYFTLRTDAIWRSTMTGRPVSPGWCRG